MRLPQHAYYDPPGYLRHSSNRGSMLCGWNDKNLTRQISSLLNLWFLSYSFQKFGTFIYILIKLHLPPKSCERIGPQKYKYTSPASVSHLFDTEHPPRPEQPEPLHPENPAGGKGQQRSGAAEQVEVRQVYMEGSYGTVIRWRRRSELKV